MKVLDSFRIVQGDIVIKPIDLFPLGKKESDEMTRAGILARGVATGNTHRVNGNAKVFKIGSNLFVDVKKKSDLIHSANDGAHQACHLPVGRFLVFTALETDHIAGVVRPVAD